MCGEMLSVVTAFRELAEDDCAMPVPRPWSSSPGTWALRAISSKPLSLVAAFGLVEDRDPRLVLQRVEQRGDVADAVLHGQQGDAGRRGPA
jgi:hypothetical protein